MSEPSSQSTAARKVRAKSRFHGGLERTLDTTGFIVMLLVGANGLLLLIRTKAAAAIPVIWMLLSAWLCRILLRTLAEHLRLQKRAQGLPYDGQISEAKEEVTYACSECGAILHSTTRCDSCGRTISEAADGES